MTEDRPGTHPDRQRQRGRAPGTAAMIEARREVLQNLDLGRILVDLERTNEAALRGEREIHGQHLGVRRDSGSASSPKG